MMRVEGKIKGLSALFRYLPQIQALAALTLRQKVIQTSDGKIKGTHSLFLQSIGRNGLGATCGVCDRVGFNSVRKPPGLRTIGEQSARLKTS
jgi:hypothetical protein